MEDDSRVKLLRMTQPQLQEVAEVCNRYPSVSLTASLEDTEPGEDIEVQVYLMRDEQEDDILPPVKSKHYTEVRKA